MHSQDKDLERYLDNALAPVERVNIEKHLAGCSTCRTRLNDLQAQAKALSELLQSWALPPELSQLDEPVLLPTQTGRRQLNPGFIGWMSGLGVMLLFVLIRAIFWLSGQLNWLANLASLLGFNERIELWRVFQFRPFFLAYLGELGEGIGLILAFILPVLLYVVAIGTIVILFFNWLSLTLAAGRPHRMRS